MNGLSFGLGVEKGLTFGDFGDGTTKGGRTSAAFPKLLLPKILFVSLLFEEKAFLKPLVPIAEANGLIFEYAEKPPKPDEKEIPHNNDNDFQ
jgi:hypothetical protein